MRISDWSSDVCSSDLLQPVRLAGAVAVPQGQAGTADGAARAPERRRDPGGPAAGRDAVAPLLRDSDREPGHYLPRHPIGRASLRERVCQYVLNLVGAVSLKKKKNETQIYS